MGGRQDHNFQPSVKVHGGAFEMLRGSGFSYSPPRVTDLLVLKGFWSSLSRRLRGPSLAHFRGCLSFRRENHDQGNRVSEIVGFWWRQLLSELTGSGPIPKNQISPD